MLAVRNTLALGAVLIASITLTSLAQAGCTATKWTGPANISSLKVRDFMKMKRETLYANLYYELSSMPAKRTPGLAPKLFHYLTYTENNEAKYHLLQALEEVAKLDEKKPEVMTVKGLCSMDKKAASWRGVAEDAK